MATPNIDKLAKDGALFRKHYTQTVPCGPARASLYTGLYSMNHRSVNNGTPLNSRFNKLHWKLENQDMIPHFLVIQTLLQTQENCITETLS
ncbi:MAG: hypothetical protein CM1200mP28_12330 [Deltaproteobacteria bacterium]|nr:MAG: hypothetical protein CM1200mP28_12330 [Deltaproteobacteria bacterium]